MGNEEEAPAGATPAQEAIADAVGRLGSASRNEMRQLKRLNEVLVFAGREPTLSRATELRAGPSPAIALAPLTPAQLDGLLDREVAIGQAIDARYESLRPSIDPATGFDEDLGGRIGFLIDVGIGHADFATSLRAGLSGLDPSAYLVVTRDTPADEIERGLLDLSDRWYDFIVVTLHVGFGNEQLMNPMLDRAAGAMFSLDAVNDLLAARKLLPRFTPSSGL